MLKWWHVRWKRLGIILIAGFAAMWLLAWVGQYAIYLHSTMSFVQEQKNISVVPVPLPDKGLVALGGIRLERFGFSLQVPWKAIDREKSFQSASVLSFKEGGDLILFNPYTAVNGRIAVGGYSGSGESFEKARDIFGATALRSNYDFLAAELAATPAQVSWWASRKSNVRNVTLLTLKAIESRDSKNIYRQSSEEMRGFQFGDPAVAPYKVILDLFDRYDRRYEIVISGKDPNHPIVTQSEVNAIVASIKPIPHS